MQIDVLDHDSVNTNGDEVLLPCKAEGSAAFFIDVMILRNMVLLCRAACPILSLHIAEIFVGQAEGNQRTSLING